MVYGTSSCSPYLISIDVLDGSVLSDLNEGLTLGETATFPQCTFWNQSDSLWDPAGCFVFNVSNVTVVCACTHLTTFGVSTEDRLDHRFERFVVVRCRWNHESEPRE